MPEVTEGGAPLGETTLRVSGLTVPRTGGGSPVLDRIGFGLKAGTLNALVGPSGCGKSTLLKAILGTMECSGEIAVVGARVGFVPQFTRVREGLTVTETLEDRYRLSRVGGAMERREAVAGVLEKVGLGGVGDRPVGLLSGGQLRRLGLALALLNRPSVLLCDEVTSGLDPEAEDAILDLLRELSATEGMTILCVIHNLEQLPRFDRIAVLREGRLMAFGTWEGIREALGIDRPQELYRRLPDSDPYLEFDDIETFETDLKPTIGGERPEVSLWAQVGVMLRQRFRLLGRDAGYLAMLGALTFGFPVLVVIFALKGLPQIEGLAMERVDDPLEHVMETVRYREDAGSVAQLVMGIVMFQVVLLGLMGANLGGREIARERSIYELDRQAGLRPMAYGLAKLGFVGLIAVAQGYWMAIFVKVICRIPGAFGPQGLVLALACLSMAWVSLGISAWARSAEKASLLSIYLVGFQLPLSGIVLALPDALVWFFRPWINAFWAWGGYVSTMRESSVYDAWRTTDVSWIPSVSVALGVLSLQGMVGVLWVVMGVRKGKG